MADELAELLPYDRCSIGLVDPGGETRTAPAAQAGDPARYTSTLFSNSNFVNLPAAVISGASPASLAISLFETADLLAALLTYRALYYLGPLLLALLVYLTLEMRSRGARARAAAQVGRGGSATRSAARGPSMRA